MKPDRWRAAKAKRGKKSCELMSCDKWRGENGLLIFQQVKTTDNVPR